MDVTGQFHGTRRVHGCMQVDGDIHGQLSNLLLVCLFVCHSALLVQLQLLSCFFY